MSHIHIPDNFDQCIITHNADQSINNGAWTELAFNTEEFDNAGMHDTVTNNGRITYKRAGIYQIDFIFLFEFNATDIRAGRVLLNGSTQLVSNGFQAIVGSSAKTPVFGGRRYEFAVDDYITLEAIQISGGALNVLTETAYSPMFWTHGPYKS